MARRNFYHALVMFFCSFTMAFAEEKVINPLMPRDPFAKRPYPDGKYEADSYLMGPFLRKLRRIRVAEGNRAAAAKIPATLEAYWQRRSAEKDMPEAARKRTVIFDQWGFWIWHEAQHDTGKDDPEWQLLLYKGIYDAAKTEKRFDWMMHVRSNCIGAYFQLGQWANSRALLNEAEDYYQGIGLALDPNKQPLEGEWDPLIPLVKSRIFPMMVPNGQATVYWERKEMQRDATKPIMLDNELISLMQDLAYEDEGMGRWDRALERCMWVRRWSNAVNQHNKTSKVKISRSNEDYYLSATVRMAGILMNLNFNDKALSMIEDGLKRKGTSQYDNRDKIQLELIKERMMVEYGKENEALLAKMDKFIALEGTAPHLVKGSMDYARLIKVSCLITQKRYNDAEVILRALCSQYQRQRPGWLDAELQLVEIMQCRGEYEKAKKTLHELMNVQRVSGRKIDELSLYRAYVSLAFRTENWQEALLAHREVMRLVEAFRMTPMLPHEQSVLSRIMAELGNTEESDRLATLARLGTKGRDERFVKKIEGELSQRPKKAVVPLASRVVIQPKRVVSVPLEGRPARAVVSLVNRGGREAKGVLRVKGLPAKIHWDQAKGQGVVQVENAAAATAQSVSGEIRIQAGTAAIFSCFGKLPGKAEYTVSLEWDGDGDAGNACEWKIGEPDKESDGALIDAAEYEDDPFFLIPVYHHLQSKSKDPVNLRVVTSQPCRVEMYDQEGILQMVDAQGNGSLADGGDWLGADADRNLAAEIIPNAETGEACFLLQLDPKDWNGKQPIKIRVEWLMNGKWYPAAEDQIIPGK
jgi:hypothetical protein